jgi:uncharacterized membrane protein YdjX (TVP38/TMEM64 family)
MIWIAAGVLLVAVAVGLWQFVPWEKVPGPEAISTWLRPLEDAWYGPLLTVLAFVILSLVLVPVLGMTLVTGLLFGPWLGSLYAVIGCFASAILAFWIGRWLGTDALHRFRCKFPKVDEHLRRNGVVAVFLIRKVPLPFTPVNMVVGASRIPFAEFLIGTALGMGPIVIVLATTGSAVGALIGGADASWTPILLLVAGLLIAIGLNRFMRDRDQEPATPEANP